MPKVQYCNNIYTQQCWNQKQLMCSLLQRKVEIHIMQNINCRSKQITRRIKTLQTSNVNRLRLNPKGVTHHHIICSLPRNYVSQQSFTSHAQ